MAKPSFSFRNFLQCNKNSGESTSEPPGYTTLHFTLYQNLIFIFVKTAVPQRLGGLVISQKYFTENYE